MTSGAEVSPVERVVARDEIRQLAYRYAHAVDSRDIDALVDLYLPEVGGGREAFRSWWDTSLREFRLSILFVGNHIIDVLDAEHATGIVYCLALEDEDGRFVEQAIRYGDRYERRDGRWLFRSRRHELFYGMDRRDSPLRLPPADWPTNTVGLGTVPYGDASWRAFWGEA